MNVDTSPLIRRFTPYPRRSQRTSREVWLTRTRSGLATKRWRTLKQSPRGRPYLQGTVAIATAWLSTACVTVDHHVAASLGMAGMQATQALSSQAAGAIDTLGNLNQWWGVRDTLVCTNVRTQDARNTCITNAAKTQTDPGVKQLIDVLNKGKQAIDALNQAYEAFVDLAHYNAGQNATSVLNTSFTDINSFLSAASALPGAEALTPITSTIEKATAGVIGFIADNKENAQILSANKDLETANNALYAALSAESNAMTNILVTLQAERQSLYTSAFDAGLIDPTDVLTPIFAEAYPGLRVQKPPSADRDVVMAAAQEVLFLQNTRTSQSISASYAASLSTLHALSAQHAKLAAQQTINIGQIQTEVRNLKADVAQVGSSNTAASKK